MKLWEDRFSLHVCILIYVFRTMIRLEMRSSKMVTGSVKSFWLLREIILKILLPNRKIYILAKMLTYLGLSSAPTPEPLETDNSPVPRRFFDAPNDDPTFHDLSSSSSSSHENDESSLHFDGSALLLGLWECADQARTDASDSKQGTPTTEEKVESMLRHVESGLTTIDAADHYGDSEKMISKFLQVHGAKHPIEICTKWCPKPGPMTYEVVLSAVHKSLDTLFPANMVGSGRVIDVLHFHWWDYSDTRYVDVSKYFLFVVVCCLLSLLLFVVVDSVVVCCYCC